jgi:hypothetical protein
LKAGAQSCGKKSGQARGGHMALSHFLYKDESLIASLYAQIFRGRLVQIDQGQTDTRTDDAEGGVNVQIASGKAKWGNKSEESRHEIFDPHDAATLDVLNHFQKFSVVEQDSKRGDVLFLSGGICLVPYEHRKILLDFGFEANKGAFEKQLSEIKSSKHRSSLIELAKKSCIGEVDDVRFFFRSVTGRWYWGALQKQYISPNFFTLQIACGLDLIPMSIVALNLGGSNNAPDAKPEYPAGFAQSIHHIASMTNGLLAGNGILFTAALAPLALARGINADEAGEDVTTA